MEDQAQQALGHANDRSRLPVQTGSAAVRVGLAASESVTTFERRWRQGAILQGIYPEKQDQVSQFASRAHASE